MDAIMNVTVERLPVIIENAVYFSVCEALTNAVKHANSKSVYVKVGKHGKNVLVEVQDYGLGGANELGHGLTNMRDRICALGGDLKIYSPPGSGTRLTMRIPCD
jgi:signal transduction histidine kinase